MKQAHKSKKKSQPTYLVLDTNTGSYHGRPLNKRADITNKAKKYKTQIGNGKHVNVESGELELKDLISLTKLLNTEVGVGKRHNQPGLVLIGGNKPGTSQMGGALVGGSVTFPNDVIPLFHTHPSTNNKRSDFTADVRASSGRLEGVINLSGELVTYDKFGTRGNVNEKTRKLISLEKGNENLPNFIDMQHTDVIAKGKLIRTLSNGSIIESDRE